MYFVGHPPPHFHAEYGEREALITIENLQIFSGDLPSRAFKLVEEWASLHRDELRDLWDLARQSQPLKQDRAFAIMKLNASSSNRQLCE
jgi:hypothetical protein